MIRSGRHWVEITGIKTQKRPLGKSGGGAKTGTRRLGIMVWAKAALSPIHHSVEAPMTPDRRRRVVALLVLVHLVVFSGAVLWNRLTGPQAWAEPAVTWPVFLSQLGLLSIWAGLGRRRWFPSLALIGLLSFAVISVQIPSAFRAADQARLASLLWVSSLLVVSTMMFPVVLSLTVARRLGWRLVLFLPGPPPAGAPLRFSVWHLLALTAVAAGFLSAAHYVRALATFEEQSLASPAGTSAFGAGVGLSVILVSLLVAPLLAVWGCLGAGRPGLRLLAASFCCLAIGSLSVYCLGGDAGDYALVAGTTLLQLAIVAASLLVFRAVGYRVIRHPTEGDAAKRAAGSD